MTLLQLALLCELMAFCMALVAAAYAERYRSLRFVWATVAIATAGAFIGMIAISRYEAREFKDRQAERRGTTIEVECQ